ncbi:trace amine-associated receptor 13c-like [Astyanax mexicanus]|uniref:trace amine-associated receptor 13c-like n=1 Tax=Astyanax mexicanus TaxID=7994 RepID=UPI0020CAA725|nr:trace amine-associated receptor 13c-like [Astyanax mexicanus]
MEVNNTEFRHAIEVLYCFPDHNISCRKEVRTGTGNILLFIFLSCISVCTVFLNLLVIISISHFKQLHTPTNLLILSLAAADLLVGMFVMPVNIIQLMDSCWYLGKMACSIFSVVNFLSILASLCSLTFIAVDRYIAVCDPLLYSTRVTACKTSVFIILGWSVAAFYVIMVCYFNDHLLPSQISSSCYGECVLAMKYSWLIVDLVVSFLTPCSVILVLYFIIFKVAIRQAKAVSTEKNGTSNNHGPGSSSFETKAAKKLGTVIFVYISCWIPFYLCSVTVENFTSVSVVWTVFGWLILINSSVNPLIYGIFYSWFRSSCKFIVTCRIFESSSSRFNLFHDPI